MIDESKRLVEEKSLSEYITQLSHSSGNLAVIRVREAVLELQNDINIATYKKPLTEEEQIWIDFFRERIKLRFGEELSQ